jgi:hypothetical protein
MLAMDNDATKTSVHIREKQKSEKFTIKYWQFPELLEVADNVPRVDDVEKAVMPWSCSCINWSNHRRFIVPRL